MTCTLHRQAAATAMASATTVLCMQVNIGRLQGNTVSVPDNEISGHHVSMRWDASSRAWQVMDLGSLNGTMLNDRIISTSNRKPGRALRLSSDDILQLGSRTKFKITCVPHEMTQVVLHCACICNLGPLPVRVQGGNACAHSHQRFACLERPMLDAFCLTSFLVSCSAQLHARLLSPCRQV